MLSTQGPRECSWVNDPSRESGVYTIFPFGTSDRHYRVYCVFSVDGTIGTVFQRRFDGSENFIRNWTSYKEGFGNADGEYWLGHGNTRVDIKEYILPDLDTEFMRNDVIHALTSYRPHSLKVVLTDHHDKVSYVEYSHAKIAEESDNYRLTVGQKSGNAADCLGGRWNGMQFSTFDRDNDHDARNCADLYKGAWWNEECHCGNLNGPYLNGQHDTDADGMDWDNTHYSYKESMMMLIDDGVQWLGSLTTPSNPAPLECSDLNLSVSGVYTIFPFGSYSRPKEVYCVVSTDGSIWTVFQRRFDGFENFTRDWTSYKEGFGNVYGEYWLGNDILHMLTSSGSHSLKVELTSFDDKKVYAEYGTVTVGDESDAYRLMVEHKTGNAADCLGGRWNAMQFSTFDRDNDQDARNCADLYKGAWWNEACHCGNLNGPYLNGYHATVADGMDWDNTHYSYKESMMMIRKVLQTAGVIIG